MRHAVVFAAMCGCGFQPVLARDDAAIAPDDVARPGIDAPMIDAPPAVQLRVNAAGPSAYTGIDFPGVWAADTVCNGLTWNEPAAVNNTQDDVLFQYYRYDTSNFGCALGPLPAGDYRVTLLFAEVYWGPGCSGGGSGTGVRDFDIALEGTVVAQDVDVFAQAGGCAASITSATGHPITKVFPIHVADGTLNVEIRPKNAKYGMLSAVQVESQ